MARGILRAKHTVCTSTVQQDVSLDAFNPGCCIRWKQITGIDEDAATTLIQVGWKRNDEFFPFRGAVTAAAGRSVRLFGDVRLPPEYRPTARFFGATLGDDLAVYAAGEMEK